MQLEHWIGEEAGDAGHGQRWADGTESNQLGIGPGDDEAADEDVISRPNVLAGGDIQLLRRSLHSGGLRVSWKSIC